jgi:hypothetical protein
MRKLFDALAITAHDPAAIPHIGAFWCPGEPSIICTNSHILACYFKLKPNSVNKNLQSLGWKRTHLALQRRDPHGCLLPSPQQWHYRASTFLLTRFSPVEAFDVKFNPSIEHDPLISLVRDAEHCHVQLLLESLRHKPPNWITRFVGFCESIWRDRFHRTSSEACPIEAVAAELAHSVLVRAILSHFARDARDLRYHEFLRFVIYFGFSAEQTIDTAKNFISSIGAPYPWVSLVPTPDRLIPRLQAATMFPCLVSLSETPGTFLIVADTVRTLEYDCLDAIFLSGSQRWSTFPTGDFVFVLNFPKLEE